MSPRRELGQQLQSRWALLSGPRVPGAVASLRGGVSAPHRDSPAGELWEEADGLCAVRKHKPE